MLEQTEEGFAVQVPDLAISAYGKNIESAKTAATEAIRINLETYIENDMPVPDRKKVDDHLKNPDFQGLLFAYIQVEPEILRQAA